MKTLFLKALALAAPFAIFFAIELFVLPIDAFTFRVWEAALVSPSYDDPYLKGPFIPNLHIEKIESGDHRVPDGPTRHVEWFTDAYGYRNHPSTVERFDIVAIGDSLIAGSFLDQRDTMPEKLARACDCSVYNHAFDGPSDMERFLRQERFAKFPPKFVIFEFRDIDIEIASARYPALPGHLPVDQHLSNAPNWRIQLEVLKQRHNKELALNWARARLGTAIKQVPSARVATGPASASAKEVVEKNAPILVERFLSYKHAVEERGSRFVLFMMSYDVEFEGLIVPIFERAGFDILTLPRVNDRRGTYIQSSDSHWTEAGAAAAAQVVANYVREQGISAGAQKNLDK